VLLALALCVGVLLAAGPDLAISVALGLDTFALAYLGIVVSLRPVTDHHSQKLHEVVFITFGILAIVLVIWQGIRANSDKQTAAISERKSTEKITQLQAEIHNVATGVGVLLGSAHPLVSVTSMPDRASQTDIHLQLNEIVLSGTKQFGSTMIGAAVTVANDGITPVSFRKWHLLIEQPNRKALVSIFLPGREVLDSNLKVPPLDMVFSNASLGGKREATGSLRFLIPGVDLFAMLKRGTLSADTRFVLSVTDQNGRVWEVRRTLASLAAEGQRDMESIHEN
jgi:hypothetical protein